MVSEESITDYLTKARQMIEDSKDMIDMETSTWGHSRRRRCYDFNIGHGHVFPRADGAKARCGGVVLCEVCMRDNMLHMYFSTEPYDDGKVERWIVVEFNGEHFLYCGMYEKLEEAESAVGNADRQRFIFKATT